MWAEYRRDKCFSTLESQNPLESFKGESLNSIPNRLNVEPLISWQKTLSLRVTKVDFIVSASQKAWDQFPGELMALTARSSQG